MNSPLRVSCAALSLVALVVTLGQATGTVVAPAETGGPNGEPSTPLADASDRTAFRSWFTLLADLQFERAAPEVVDCAALVRLAYREALRAHTPEWTRRVGLPFSPPFPDVHGGPKPTADGWPVFRLTADKEARYGEFADARTLVRHNARAVSRDVDALHPGDLLYFHQPGQQQPDHLMVFVGRSFFDPDANDWVVYHTGPTGTDPGEVRKLRLADLRRHPASRWRPLAANPLFVGVFRWSLL